MMYHLTMQDVTYQDYPIQYFTSPSTGIVEMDIMEIWDSVLSTWIRKLSEKLSYPDLTSLLETDSSSIWPHFEIKTETSLIKGLTTISEEDIAMEMIEHDFVVKMPPKKRYKIQVHVRNIRKGKPRPVELDEFLTEEGDGKCGSLSGSMSW